MRWAIGLSAALCASVASAAPTIDKAWTSDGRTATAKAVEIGLPLQAGTFEGRALRDLGTAGADLIAQYETHDTKVIGTIFLYAASRPDIGLTFLATDQTIRARLRPDVTVVEDQLIPINGVANAGRRVVYEGKADAKLTGDFDGRVYSTATLFRAADWIVVVRATGPVSRSTEISQGLDALVAGIVLGKKVRPFPTAKIAVEACAPSPARSDVDVTSPPMSEAIEAMLALNSMADDAGSVMANPLLGRIDRVCLERSERMGQGPLLTYRVLNPSDGTLNPRLVMLHGDAGTMLLALESKKHPGEYFIARHAIGTTYIIGRTPSLPSTTQLQAILGHPDNQPAVVVMKNDYLSDPKSQQININCSLTAEGCDKGKK